MCGFFLISDDYTIDHGTAISSFSKIQHRGPDNSSYIFDDELNLFIGHSRLSIIDLNSRSNQPKQSSSGRYICAFNGEIYNFKELICRFSLPSDCYCDTDVLLAMFERFGTNAFSHFDGMFSGVLLDTIDRKIVCFRDRFGIKPLYYYLSKNRFVVSSEIPPILSYLSKFTTIEPDHDTIYTYLCSSLYDHSSNTFFKSISSLDPGHYLSLSLDIPNPNPILKQWYSLIDNIEPHFSLSYTESLELCSHLLESAVTSNMISDVSVGLNVSGGTDSSLLSHFAYQNSPSCLHFNQNYPEPYSEFKYVQCPDRSKLKAINLGFSDIYDLLNNVVTNQAEPFGGITVIGYYYLYKYGKALGTTVFLDGNGIDEAFMGYQKYYQTISHSNSIDGSKVDNIDFLHNDFAASCSLLPPRLTGFENSPRASSALDLLSTKIPRGLRFNDRASMYNGCELRVPFLDHKLIEFAFSLPPNFLINNGHYKFIFREIVAKLVNKDVAFAPKRFVQSPQREWIACEFHSLINDLISTSYLCEMNFLDKISLQSFYSRYCCGTKKNSFAVWQFLNLELWARAYL